jgi:hypothetical protein
MVLCELFILKRSLLSEINFNGQGIVKNAKDKGEGEDHL